MVGYNMSNMDKAFGAVFPILAEQASRFFDESRKVYVKYTNMTKLGENSKIVFYASKENKKLIGVGTIESIERTTPKIAWSRYCGQIFLNEDEYNQYVSMSPVKGKKRDGLEITVFVLKNLREYRHSCQLSDTLTPAGRYLTREEYISFKNR
jgi:hypothetical protein